MQLSECVFELLKTFCYFDQVSGRFRLGNVRCGSLQRIPLHLRQSGTHCHLTVARLSSPAKDWTVRRRIQWTLWPDSTSKRLRFACEILAPLKLVCFDDYGSCHCRCFCCLHFICRRLRYSLLLSNATLEGKVATRSQLIKVERNDCSGRHVKTMTTATGLMTPFWRKSSPR